MTSSAQKPSVAVSRFVESLAAMNGSNAAIDHARFAQRFGQFLYLSDSVSLADAHYRLGRIKLAPAGHELMVSTLEGLQQQLLKTREKALQDIVGSFEGKASAVHLNLPLTGVDDALNQARQGDAAAAPTLPDLAAYQYFYLNHQRALAAQMQRLRQQVRAALAKMNVAMAQLALLDEALDTCLQIPAAKRLKQVPKFIAQYFNERVPKDSVSEAQATLARATFSEALKGLLLGELEFHLEPVIGLIEALESEVYNKA